MQTPAFRFLPSNRFLWSVPLTLLGVLILAFGLQIPWLGYGYDEWHFIYYATRGVEGIKEIFHYDGHPQSIWSYILSFNLLGYDPLGWHLYSLFWRWLAVCTLWWCFHLTWPQKRIQTFSAAVLFAIYPFFSLQFFPIAYFEVWLSYVFLGLSVAFSLLAVRRSERFMYFTALAVFFKLAHIFSSEYTWFIEVIRPALIWFALPSDISLRERFRRVVVVWFPYFFLFMGAALWRGLFYVPTRTTFQVQADFLHTPLIFLKVWVLNIIPDSVLSLFTSWYEIFSPSYFELQERWNVVLLGLSLLSGLFLFFYMKNLPLVLESPQADKRWAVQALFTGMLVVACGIVPYYMAGYNIYLSKPPINSRFVLGFLPGAALVVVALLEIIVTSRRTRLVLLSLLVGFSIGWHTRYTRDVRRDWSEQSNFFRQLAWRAPGIQPGTIIRVFNPSRQVPESPAKVLTFGDFSQAMAVNAFYQNTPNDSFLSYWYIFQSNSMPIERIDEATLFERHHATTKFIFETPKELWIYFEPETGHCLRVLYPIHAEYRQYPDNVRESASYASLKAIDPSIPVNISLMERILEVDRTDHWCYYYQKAELSRQFGRWDEVTELWAQSQEKGLRPRHGMEYLPFIEGFARQWEWGKAIELSERANQISRSMEKVLCPFWESLVEKDVINQDMYGNCD
jgi:hypothetical protein